jgi:hypothetical protein
MLVCEGLKTTQKMICCIQLVMLYSKKGRAIPLQAWTDPEGSRRLRLPDFKTLGKGRW